MSEINKYSRGKIYTIRSHQTNKYYIGSTIETLSQRLTGHRCNYNRWVNNINNYITSFEILQYSDYYIELLEAYPCNNRCELHRREGELIRQYKNDLVNMIVAGRTQLEYRQEHKEHLAEYAKQYSQDNKQDILAYKTQYYINNKEQLAEQMKQYRVDNKEHLAEQSKQYRESHKEEKAEWDRQYYLEHIDDKKEYDRLYRLNNIEHKKELSRNYCKLKHTCDCGLVVAFKHLKQHLERSNHPKLIQQLFNNELNNYNF